MATNKAEPKVLTDEEKARINAQYDEELVDIRLPISGADDGDVFVSINSRTWLIQRGVTVTVPRCVAKVIEDSENRKYEAVSRRRDLVKG